MKNNLIRMGLIAVIALLLVGALATGILAQGATKRVGIVVRFGDGKENLQIVSVPVAATTEDVLRASTLDLTITDSGYGPNVCRIGPDGCKPPADCFCDPAHFWAFWNLNSTGTGWTASPMGVKAYTPKDGDVVGFSWTGFDASYNPTVQPKVHTFADIEKSLQPTDVPEPATLVLLGGGLVSLASYVGLRRRAR